MREFRSRWWLFWWQVSRAVAFLFGRTAKSDNSDFDVDDEVLLFVLGERMNQVSKWGEQHHPDGTGNPGDVEDADAAKAHYETMSQLGLLSWREILSEEVAEAYAESDPEKLRAELLQVAAVAVAWIVDIRSRDENP